jgi:hypothetical protein
MSEEMRLPTEEEERALALLATHLEEKERDVDVEELLRRIQDAPDAREYETDIERLERKLHATPGKIRLLRAAVVLAIAATVFALFRGDPPAEGLVLAREIASALASSPDRTYHGTFRAAHGTSRPLARLLSGREVLLSTRGSSFFIRPGDVGMKLVWGRDGVTDTLWMAVPGSYGLRSAPEGNVARRVELLVEMRSMDLGRILDRLVKLCVVEERQEGEMRILEATPRGGLLARFRPGDRADFTKVILRARGSDLALVRVETHLAIDGEETGTLVWELTGEEKVSDELYTLEGHLLGGETVIEATNVAKTLEALQGIQPGEGK